MMTKFLNKINLPAILTLVLGLGLMSGSFAQRNAFAGKFDTVPTIQVSGLDSQSGRYLHVLYAVGQLGFIDLNSRNPELFVIRKESQNVQITPGKLLIPSVQIEKTPGRGSYNMIVFAIANTPQIKWENYSQNPNPTSYKVLRVIFKAEVDSLGEISAIPVSF